jgi:LTXXQ motif family protein
MFSPSILWGTVVALLLAPAIGLAQPASSSATIPAPAAAPPPPTAAPAPASGAAPAPPPALSAAARAAIDERIAKLQAQLGITQAQMPLWSAFAEAMRDNAAATDALFTRRAGAVATMNAAENMHSYAQIARAYADNTERLAAAFDSVYASLSDTQKQAADTLFRQQALAAAKPQRRR